MKNFHWLDIDKYCPECCSYFYLHLPQRQCTGRGLLQTLAHMNYHSRSHTGCHSLQVAFWLAQNHTGSQGWIKMILHSICRNQNLKLHNKSTVTLLRFMYCLHYPFSVNKRKPFWKPVCENLSNTIIHNDVEFENVFIVILNVRAVMISIEMPMTATKTSKTQLWEF